MKSDLLDLHAPPPVRLNALCEPPRVRVVLLDQDNLQLAFGSAILPSSLGVGVFFPDCPMPTSRRLAAAKCFALPGGEQLHFKGLSLRGSQPPHYDFRASLG